MRIRRLVHSISWKYAVGEVSLIVIGILIALFIDNWATERANSKLEAQYLQALLDEATISIENLQGNLRVNEISYDSLLRAKQLVDSGDMEGDPVLIVHSLMQGLQGGVSPRFNTAVFDDLISTGRLALISDEAVRRTIIDTYAVMQIAVLRARDERAEFDLRLDAVLVRHLPFEYFQWNGPRVSMREGSPSADVLRASLDSFLRDSQMHIEINATLNAQIRAISSLERLEGRLEEYRDYLIDVIGD